MSLNKIKNPINITSSVASLSSVAPIPSTTAIPVRKNGKSRCLQQYSHDFVMTIGAPLNIIWAFHRQTMKQEVVGYINSPKYVLYISRQKTELTGVPEETLV